MPVAWRGCRWNASSMSPPPRPWPMALTAARPAGCWCSTWGGAPSMCLCCASLTASSMSRPPAGTPSWVATTGIDASSTGWQMPSRRTMASTCAATARHCSASPRRRRRPSRSSPACAAPRFPCRSSPPALKAPSTSRPPSSAAPLRACAPIFSTACCARCNAPCAIPAWPPTTSTMWCWWEAPPACRWCRRWCAPWCHASPVSR